MSRKPSVLIVEDDKASGEMLKTMCKNISCEVINVVDTGEEAISIAKNQKPDLIIMDISLSGKIDGINAAEEIYSLYTIPFIYLTAGSDKKTFERAKKTMPFGYILKPFDKNILKVTIEIALHKFKVECELIEYRNDLERKIEERTNKIKLFSHAVNQSPNSIVIIDCSGNVEYVNTKFVELSGYKEKNLIGVNVNKPKNPILSEPEVWEKMTKMNQWRGEIYHLNKNGEIYYGSAYVSSIKDESGQISHYIIEMEDITEKKRELMELDQAKETLERSKINMLDKEVDWKKWKEKMKSLNTTRADRSLYKNIHDSFTQGAGFGALTSLIEMLSSTSEKKGDKYIVDAQIFELAVSNVNTAQDTFKTFSSIDWIIANDFEMEKVSLKDMYNFVKTVILKAEEFCTIKKSRIIINDMKQAYEGISVMINKEFLYKALFEALLNALKFSKSNTAVSVIFQLIKSDISISILNIPQKVEIGDDITGVPKEYERDIFEPFFRLDRNVYEQYKTLDFGLGLTLIDKIVNKHGGDVIIENITDHSDMKKESHTKVSLSMKFPVKDN